MTRKHAKKTALLLVLTLGIALLLITSGVSPKSEATQSNDIQLRVGLLNAKARLARSGDERAVGDLADEVFKQFGPPELAFGLSLYKDRLVRAEINYRRQGVGGIPEKNLVKAMNGLTRRLGAPDYSRVSTPQVRFLRVNMLGGYPGFISQAPEGNPGKSIVNSEMSPLEAAGLALLMVNQKLSNKDFQVTPAEWATQRHLRAVERWNAYKSGKPAPEKSTAQAKVVVETMRSKELQRLFSNRVADVPPLVDRALDDLGIPR
ncbi:MAG TPA: hypothetical protein VHS05_08920 [Pyrinomonadaceae bacterium]|jgi:hypothetical protein|nr:hypothetical protein [Pyrinomonadaceae bacterium]